MAEELEGRGSGVQELISRIREQGVSAGRDEAERVVAEARLKADKLLRDARAEIDKERRETEAQIEADRDAALEALKLAARDTSLELQTSVVAAFERQVARLVSETTLDVDFLKTMVLVLAGHSADEFIKDKDIRIEASHLVFADESDPQARERATRATLALSTDMLREGVELIPADDVHGGVRVQVVDDNLEIDLTSEAISRLLLRHMLPRFRNLLSGAE